MVEQNVLNEFVEAIQPQPEENKNRVYSAEVSNIDDEGTVWVRIAGSEKDTPTALSAAEVKRGDFVNVEWRNNKLYIAGNYSNPAAGVERVANVETAAEIANQAAANAVADANVAKEAAESAVQSAESAQQSATTAYNLASQVQSLAQQANQNAQSAQQSATQASQSASDAMTQAQSAQTSASQASQSASQALTQAQSANASALSALRGLSTVEDVVDTLEWITAHGEMESQAGKAFDANKVYFIVDQNGDYVVQNVHYSIVTNPQASQIANYYCLSIDESIQNYIATHVVVDSEGLWLIPDNGENKVLIAVGGSGHAYPASGTYIIDANGCILAKFLDIGAQIGQDNYTHLEMGYNSMQLIDKEGSAFFYVSDLRDKNDNWQATLTETFYGDGNTSTFTVRFDVSAEISASVDSEPTNTATRVYRNYTFANAPAVGNKVTIVYKSLSVNLKAYSLGTRGSAPKGPYSIVEGVMGNASGYCSHAEGCYGNASSSYSHAEGYQTSASGDAAHTEGYQTTASGDYSHAEGYKPTASGDYSHAEGYETTADGRHSHAEGYQTETNGEFGAHAEGSKTLASGNASHAEGHSTEANNFNTHAEGRETTASGENAHAEGLKTTASGNASHAEGYQTTASGNDSHAQNIGTKASKHAQTVIGSYNIEDTSSTTTHPSHITDYGEYALIIGNGEFISGSPVPSNALTVDWAGNVVTSGDVTDGANNVLSDKLDSSDLPTNVSEFTNDAGYIAEDGNGDISVTRNIIAGGSITDGNGNILSDKLEEDNNGDLSITRNISAGGDVTDGSGNVLSDKLEEDSNGDLSVTRNLTAGGSVTDGNGNVLSAKANSANMFYITNVTPSGYNFNANQYRSLSSTGITTYSGYTPIIVQARCTNKSGLHVFNYSISGTTLNYEVINRTGSQVNDANFAFRILHIRNELIG